MEVGEKMAELSDRDTINRHESAIRHHEEMLYMKDHERTMKPGEKRRYWAAVRKQLEIDIKMHELYVVIKDRVERYGG